MRKMRNIVTIIFCMVIVFSIGGLYTKAFAAENITIAFSVPSLHFIWFVYSKDIALDEAKKLGVKIRVYDARNSIPQQISDIEDMITRGVDGVVMSPIDVNALVPGLEKLDRAGIPCATFDRKVEGAPYLDHVSADNIEGGRMAALYIAAKLDGKGEVIELQGELGASVALERRDGFHQVIDEFPQLKIVFSQTAEWDREKAISIMEDAITVHPNFDAVWGHDDNMMIGALSAIKAAGYKPDDILAVGFDAVEDALKAIQAGEADATIEQYPGGQVRQAVRYLVNFIRKGEMPPEKEVYLAPTLIIKENIQLAEQYGAIK